MAIFISYRRHDSEAETGRIDDHLRAAFGEKQVFRDVDDIPIGVDFLQYIGIAIRDATVALVVIGKSWEPERLADPSDVVRLEIEAILERRIPVIPVLVEDAQIPETASLPGSLHPLTRRNALRIDSGADFREHMAKLVSAVRGILVAQGIPTEGPAPVSSLTPVGGSTQSVPAALRRRAYLALGVGAAVLVGIGVLVARSAMRPAPVDDGMRVAELPGDATSIAVPDPAQIPTPSPEAGTSVEAAGVEPAAKAAAGTSCKDPAGTAMLTRTKAMTSWAADETPTCGPVVTSPNLHNVLCKGPPCDTLNGKYQAATNRPSLGIGMNDARLRAGTCKIQCISGPCDFSGRKSCSIDSSGNSASGKIDTWGKPVKLELCAVVERKQIKTTTDPQPPVSLVRGRDIDFTVPVGSLGSIDIKWHDGRTESFLAGKSVPDLTLKKSEQLIDRSQYTYVLAPCE